MTVNGKSKKGYVLVALLICALLYSGFLRAQVTLTPSAISPSVTVINMQSRVNVYNANPTVPQIHPKSAKDRLFIPPNPVPDLSKIMKYAGDDSSNKSKDENSASVSTISTTPAVDFTAIIDDISTIPPDVAGAVGTNHVLTTLNNGIMIQDKNGNLISFIDNETFFTNSETTALFDPRVLFDPHTQRYYWIILDGANVTSSNIILAVSQTDNPLGNWNVYSFKTNADNTANWFDYPLVGYNKDWIVISGNMFTVGAGSFVTAKMFVIKKSEALAGSNVTNYIHSFGGNDQGFSISPAVVADNTTAFIPLLSVWDNTSGTYKLWNITNSTGGAPVLNPISYPSLGSANGFHFYTYWVNQAPQMGMTTYYNGIDDGDIRMCNLVLRNGKLWAVHTAFLSTTGNFGPNDVFRGAAQWLNLNPNTGAINDWGKIADNDNVSMGSYSVPENSFAFPSIAVNDYEDVLISFAHFSPNLYPSASYVVREHGTSVFSPIYTFKSGLEHYYKTYGGNRNRWGDYTTAMIDPNGKDFWVVGEYAYTNDGSYDRWSTHWARLNVMPPAGITLTSVSSKLCVEKNYNLTYTISGSFNSGNIFKAQLSNSAGLFSSPVQIGTLTSTAGGNLVINVPQSVSGGSNYKIRVVSTNPVVTSTNSLNTIVIGKDLVVQNGTPPPYEAVDDITVQDAIITGNKKFRAGKSITLTGTVGTHVKTDNGAVFEAVIEGCAY